MILRALLTLLPLPVFRKRFYYWLLQDAVQAGASGRAAVDEAVADWGVAQRCFLPMPMIPATVLGDEALKSFHVPALFLIGENEKMYPAQKAASRLNRLAPQIKTEIIHQAGHDLTFTQPNLVTKKMMTFLEQT